MMRMREPELDQALPTELPLLTALVADWAGARRPLTGVTAVLIQHQLGSIVPMVRALLALGLEPERTYFIDIPYTANATVRAALEGLGIPPLTSRPPTTRSSSPTPPTSAAASRT
jgi:hypothetical protein